MHNAMATSLLPQYKSSNEFMERFLDAIHEEGSSIVRSPNSQGIKTIDGSELSSDYLDYFIDNKSAIENEFFTDLSEKIGKIKTAQFCKIISEDWYDGKKRRNSPQVNGIKQSIADYLATILSCNDLSQIVTYPTIVESEVIFSREDIASILTVNDQNMHKHLALWLEARKNLISVSLNDVFFRRGLALNTLFEDGETYIEQDYISSYSIAFSAPEKFAQMTSEKIPTIVNADCEYFQGRILFFSPFIRGMDIGQLEVGIIPREQPDQLHYQGEHGGIHEFLIGDHLSLQL